MRHKKKKQKPFDPNKEKEIRFVGNDLAISDYQRDYYIGYPIGFWLHKALALMHFIENPSKLSMIRFTNDLDAEESIIENLKMEIHMMVFHSAESLFLTVLGHYFYPAMPWFWMSTCTQNKFNNVINLWQEVGLGGIIREPEKWLRDTMYPTISEIHKGYQNIKDSATFTKKYLDRLVNEYTRHKEYNAYRNGLRIFPSPAHIQGAAVVVADHDDTSREKLLSLHANSLEHLIYEIPHNEEAYEYSMSRALRKFNTRVDINIISTNTRILQNFLERKRVESKTVRGEKGTFSLALFDKLRVEDIFSTG